MDVTRREFLLRTGHACVGYALGAAAFTAGVQRFGLINLLAQGSDYKALVCVFLAGGNDGNNMIVPTTTPEYNAYAGARSSSGLGIPRDSLSPSPRLSIANPLRLHPQPDSSSMALATRNSRSSATSVPSVQPNHAPAYKAAPLGPTSFSHTRIRWRSGIPPSPIE